MMNVEQLRKQAKELVKAARAGDAEALARLEGREPILARAQLVLAREHGYPSWAALAATAEASIETVVLAATDGRRTRAELMLAARPELEGDPWVRLVLGVDWRGDPNMPGEPHSWAPLLYACHSCFQTTALARELLERGADPNACFVNEYGNMSALYGAAGIRHDAELTRALLEAGANPDDGESLYHATAAESPECVRILLEHGAQTAGTNALAAALDTERLEHVRLMLEHGADPNENFYVAHAVRRGCGPELIELLIAHGADVDRPGGETWRGDVPLRTPYQHALLRGKDKLAELLARLGASTEVDPADDGIASLARGVRPQTPLPETLDPDAQEVIVLSALRGNLDLVLDVVGPEFSGVVGGSPEGTLLHHAAWIGSCELVGRLLERGADPLAASGADFDTPLAWAALGSQHHELPNRDFIGVAERLTAAGAELELRFLDVADGPLAEWLQSTSIASPKE
ncbi:MAG: ankyrin repeat domain-containing protein [Actinobacteria bacterium]|nr:ankyrin repeat domain-containing protein [Actinomycetota bacterium]